MHSGGMCLLPLSPGKHTQLCVPLCLEGTSVLKSHLQEVLLLGSGVSAGVRTLPCTLQRAGDISKPCD